MWLISLVGFGGALCLFGQTKPNYKLKPLDVIIVDVLGEVELTKREIRVTTSGTITFPYLEDRAIKVEGLTTAEVETRLRELLMEDYFVDPKVSVQVREYTKLTVIVIGEVNKQGPVDFPSEQAMTILEAIGYAGGFTKLADKRGITVSRKGQKPIKFDLKDWLKKPDEKRLLHLEPDDVIFVDETTF